MDTPVPLFNLLFNLIIGSRVPFIVFNIGQKKKKKNH